MVENLPIKSTEKLAVKLAENKCRQMSYNDYRVRFV